MDMSGRIFIYGDSFANSLNATNNWINIVGELLNYKVINHGRYATALSWSFNNFMISLKQGQFQRNDVIIFLCTFSNRIWVKNMPDPSISMLVYAKNKQDYIFKKHSNWIGKHFDYLRWAIENIYDDDINYEKLKIVSYLKCFSEINKDKTVIVMKCFPDRYDYLIEQILDSDNFFNLFKYQSLWDISVNECGFDEKSSEEESQLIVESNDALRKNHITDQNAIILSNMICDIIRNKSIENYDDNNYQKYILRYVKSW